jgi:uncharacterized membrane protein YkvA (DUF1232 family)
MFRSLLDQGLLTWRMLLDKRVPFWAKLVAIAPFIYVISPIDFIPDVLVGLGQLDDIGIILAGMRLFEAVVPDYIVQEHRAAIARRDRPIEVVDVPNYRVTSENEKPKRQG